MPQPRFIMGPGIAQSATANSPNWNAMPPPPAGGFDITPFLDPEANGTNYIDYVNQNPNMFVVANDGRTYARPGAYEKMASTLDAANNGNQGNWGHFLTSVAIASGLTGMMNPTGLFGEAGAGAGAGSGGFDFSRIMPEWEGSLPAGGGGSTVGAGGGMGEWGDYTWDDMLRDVGIEPGSEQFSGGQGATGNPFDMSANPSGGMPNLPTGTNSVIQQLVKSLLGGGSPTGGQAGAGGAMAGGGGALGGLGGIISGLMSLFGKNMIDPAKANTLYNAGLDTYNSSLDPQGAMYGRTMQQLQDQIRASQGAHGTAMSPYAAGVENKGLSDFNIDWVNSMLNRRSAGLRGFSDAANVSFGQSNNERNFQTTQQGAGTNALLTGLGQSGIGSWLNNMIGGTSNTGSGSGIPNTAAYDAFGNDSYTVPA